MREIPVGKGSAYVDDFVKGNFDGDGELEYVCSDGELRELLDTIESSMNGYSDNDRYAIRVAVDEAYQNASEHSGCERVPIHYLVTDEHVAVTIDTKAKDFDPTKVVDCGTPENIGKLGGRGLAIIMEYLDKVCYSEDYSVVMFVKNKTAESLTPTK